MEEPTQRAPDIVFVQAKCAVCGGWRMARQFDGHGPGSRMAIDIGPARGLLCREHPEATLEIAVCWAPLVPEPVERRGILAWRLRTYWNHGDENGSWYFTSRALAEAQLFEYVKAWWALEFDPVKFPMPTDPQEAVQRYYEETPSETWSIEGVRIRNQAHPLDDATMTQMTDSHFKEARIFYNGVQVFPDPDTAEEAE